MLTVGVIGARRRRQGIGEHVARYLARAGAEVRAVLGTTPASAAEAREALAAHGIRCRAYASLSEMLDREGLQALAICSPVAAHREALDEAARRGLHALCEKPLTFDPERDAGADAREIAARFREAGRHLALVTQWPYTLETFRRLYPEMAPGGAAGGGELWPGEPPRRFAMRLSPTATGEAMLVDSLSHPISVVRALAGPGEARFRGFERRSPDLAWIRWEHAGARGAVEVEVELGRCPEPPRPAWIEIDGRRAVREVRLPGYAMELVADDGRRAPLPDPLERLVADFVAAAERGAPADVEAIASDAAALDALVRAARPAEAAAERR